jgi:phosphatidylinositol 4-kinase type 2
MKPTPHHYEPLPQSLSDGTELDYDLEETEKVLESEIPSLFLLNPTLQEDIVQTPQDSLVSGNGPIDYFGVDPTNSAEFLAIFDSVKEAIEMGVYPVRISKGSSGSYFCKNKDGKIVGVFKPKNEEPYGHLNPKWIKWFHRNCFPCCFGRSCIIPNLGYLSEAAASFVDRQLGLHIVPRTEIVYLSSPSFHYSFKERWSHRLFKKPLPPKIGSFQLFLDGYHDATTFFQSGYARLDKDHPLDWCEETQREFQYGFERLVVLDYLIRNTDRGSDNWMVRSTKLPQPKLDDSMCSSNISMDLETAFPRNYEQVQIAAIDHGLAFPTHHPNRVRSYPYGWTQLPIVHTPFSKRTCNQVLPLLTSVTWWDDLLLGLERLFQIDSDFKPAMWQKQRAVIRGQGHNLVDVLGQARILPLSPATLVQRPLVMLYENTEERDSVSLRIETFSQNACFSRC